MDGSVDDSYPIYGWVISTSDGICLCTNSCVVRGKSNTSSNLTHLVVHKLQRCSLLFTFMNISLLFISFLFPLSWTISRIVKAFSINTVLMLLQQAPTPLPMAHSLRSGTLSTRSNMNVPFSALIYNSHIFLVIKMTIKNMLILTWKPNSTWMLTILLVISTFGHIHRMLPPFLFFLPKSIFISRAKLLQPSTSTVWYLLTNNVTVSSSYIKR